MPPWSIVAVGVLAVGVSRFANRSVGEKGATVRRRETVALSHQWTVAWSRCGRAVTPGRPGGSQPLMAARPPAAGSGGEPCAGGGGVVDHTDGPKPALGSSQPIE